MGFAIVDVSDLAPDSIRVVALVVERLRLGQERYGRLELATDPRDLRRETAEELLDAAVYSACAVLRQEAEEGPVRALQAAVKAAEDAGDMETARAKAMEMCHLLRERAAAADRQPK